MTATDELRRMLDERGVEHYDGTESTLWLKDEHGYRASADELTSGRMSVHIWCDTPAQAIAATLGDSDATRERHGVGTCKADETETWQGVCMSNPIRYARNLTIHVMECSACGGTYEYVNGSYDYCPNCGRRVVE